LSKPRVGDVVEVRWLDSESVHLGWRSAKEYRRTIAHEQSYRTAGYWLAGGDRISIALSISPANGHIDDAMSIPKACVIEVQVLGRSNKRVRKALR
jgi:hypothetical protein